MRLLLNKRQARLGRFTAAATTTAGLILLCIAAAIAIFLPEGASSLPILCIGILSSWIGIHTGNKWLRPPIPHHALDAALKGFGKNTTIYHYYMPARHVLICHKGILSVTTNAQDINLTIKGEQWKNNEHILTLIRRILTLDAFINPRKSAAEEERRLHKWLARNLPYTNPTIHTIIVFTNPRAKLDISKQPEIPVAYADKRTPTLKTTIRQLPDTFNQEQLDQITSIIDKKFGIGEPPNEQHAKKS